MSQLFALGGQSTGASASASVLPMNIQDWFPLGLTSWISLQFQGLSRVFSSTTVQKHQFLDAQSSIWSNSHIHTWLLKKTLALTLRIFVGKVMSIDDQNWVFCSLPALVRPFLWGRSSLCKNQICLPPSHPQKFLVLNAVENQVQMKPRIQGRPLL